jgi:hypothetical protein
MAKQYNITIRGKQRDQIDADLMAHLVVMLGRKLAEEARQDMEAEQESAATEGQANDEAGRDRAAMGADR